MTRFDILNIIQNLQEEAVARYGSGCGHAWSSGYLGALFADALSHYVSESDRNAVVRLISEHTDQMIAERTFNQTPA